VTAPDAPDGGTTGKVPDYPQTRLALRTWQIDRDRLVLRSLNAPGGRTSWLAKAMASPAGNWPHDHPLAASCATGKKHDDPVPGEECSCGIYATTDLDVISSYLRKDSPVLGVVEMGGRVIPATQGYRAAYARVAVILLIDEALTEPHRTLRRLAAAYRVPAVVPHSADPESYRELAGRTSLASEAEEYLRQMEAPE
jgi:hypothetical protein